MGTSASPENVKGSDAASRVARAAREWDEIGHRWSWGSSGIPSMSSKLGSLCSGRSTWRSGCPINGPYLEDLGGLPLSVTVAVTLLTVGDQFWADDAAAKGTIVVECADQVS